MNEPTIDEQIEYQKKLGYKDNYRAAILASLERLKCLDSQPVPVEPALIKSMRGGCSDTMQIAIDYIDTLQSELKRVTEERDKWKSEADGQFQYAGRLLDQLHVAESRNRRMVELLRECNKLFAEISLGQHSGIIQVNAMSLQVKSAELLNEVGE